jgi:hypothetical protein
MQDGALSPPIVGPQKATCFFSFFLSTTVFSRQFLVADICADGEWWLNPVYFSFVFFSFQLSLVDSAESTVQGPRRNGGVVGLVLGL